MATGRSGNEGNAPPPRGKRVLLVKSDPTFSRFVTRVLAHAGHQVISVDSPSAALRIAGDDLPDLVLVDVWLSGAWDLGLLCNLVRPDGPPVVVLSDEPSEEQLQRTMDAGAVDYITSTVTARELQERVQAALSRRRAP